MKYAYLLIIPLLALGAPFGAQAMVMLDGSGEVSADTSASSSGTVMHILNASAGADVSADATTVGDMGTGSTSGSSNIDVNLQMNGSGVVVSTPAQVQSNADLDVYDHNATVSHASVAKVDTSAQDSVSVDYNHAAKLFGVIPVTITSHTTVQTNADGAVQVHTTLPWWHVLVTGGDFGTSVDSSLSASTAIQAQASANLSAAAKAQIAQVVIDSLDAHTSAMMNASVNGTLQ